MVALRPQQRKRVAWLIDGHLADDYDEDTYEARWEREFAALADEHGVPVTVLGVTTGDSLTVEGVFQVPLTELKQVWSGTLPAIFG